MKPTTFLRFLVFSAPVAIAAAACDRPDWSIDETATVAGTRSFGGSSTSGGAAVTAGTTSADPCAFDRIKAIKPIFTSQTVNTLRPARRELYAVVSDEEAEALREGGSLIPESAEGEPPDVVKMLDRVRPTSTPTRQPLIDALKPRFANVRAVWPNAWALRLVDHPGSQHVNVVRVVLREDAWIARITEGSITTLDLAQTEVPITTAVKSPERVAAIFYETTQRVTLQPGVDGCEDGRRVMVIGDESAIEEWSLGTEEVLARQDADLELLNELFKVSRACSSADRSPSFRSFTVCQLWSSPFTVSSEYTAYQWALSTPHELYKPSPQNLAALIEALQADLFEPDPYVVEPEAPAVGGGANEGGAAGAGGEPGGLGGAGGEGRAN